MRRSSSDTALDTRHYVSGAAMTPSAGAGPPPPNEAQIRARTAQKQGRAANGKGSSRNGRRVHIQPAPLSSRTAKVQLATALGMLKTARHNLSRRHSAGRGGAGLSW